MRIHQFVHTLNYGDAISGEAISLRQIFQSMGFESEIYSLHAHEKVKSFTRSWKDFEEEKHSEGQPPVIILHYSIASPLNEIFQNLTHSTRVLIYHNLTPPKWFFGYNTRVVEDLRRGMAELSELLLDTDIILADSQFNKSELQALGDFQVEVLPLFLDRKKWRIPANAGIANVLQEHGGSNILHVGRLAPNKCIEDIIKTFYFYHHKIQRKSRLWLVGADVDTELYSFELRRLVSKLRLKEAVTFVGSVADSELRAFYENSHLYMCMSEHEGFCVPLLEAMYFKTPIIAYDACAVAETLGEAGVLLDKKTPAVTAELMNRMIEDRNVAAEFVSKGKARIDNLFSDECFSQILEKVLLEKLRGNFFSERQRQRG